MSKATEKLKPIPADRTVTFYSPVEGEEVMVRTGIQENPLSYIHSLLYSGMSKFAFSGKQEREDMVSKISKKLFRAPDEKTWFNTVPSARDAIVKNFQYHITFFYNTIDSDRSSDKSKKMKEFFRSVVKDTTMLEFYKVICELIPYDSLGNIYKSFAEEIGGIDFSDWKDVAYKFFNNVLKKDQDFAEVSEERKKYVKKLVKHLVTKALNNSKSIAHQLYTDSLKENLKPSEKNFGHIADLLERDIYVIDHSTRMLCEFSPKHPKRRTSILAMSFNRGEHFEPVGILLPGNRVQRELGVDEEIVDKFYLMTTDPYQARENYPELRLDRFGNSPVKRSPAKSPEGSVVSSINSEEWSEDESDIVGTGSETEEEDF